MPIFTPRFKYFPSTLPYERPALRQGKQEANVQAEVTGEFSEELDPVNPSIADLINKQRKLQEEMMLVPMIETRGKSEHKLKLAPVRKLKVF